MRKIFRYIILSALIVFAASCSREELVPQDDYGVLKITLKSSDLETRAEMPGVENLNENLIKTVDYFLYPLGKTGESAVKYGRIETSKQTTETIRVNINEDELNNLLFVRPYTTCEVYLIVNLPDGTTIPENTNIDNLKKIALNADFSTNAIQNAFVMDGSGTAEIIDRKSVLAASGEINVDRVASKITLNVEVSNTYTESGGAIWESDPSQMKVSLFNAVSNAVILGDPLLVMRDPGLSYFDYSNKTFAKKSEAEGTTTWACDQFYSYPSQWETGADNEPYLLIQLPWRKQDESSTSYQNCYYKVILNGNTLDKNTWYNINLKLSVLGSFTPDEPKVVIDDLIYYVADWSTGVNIDAQIQGARYLVVDQNYYVMNNEEEILIPFKTSHACTLKDTSVTKVNLNTGGNVTDDDYTLELTEDGVHIRFYNTLDNNLYSETFDFTPYTITFNIRHIDDPYTTEEITITQYPAIYGVAEQNSDYNNGGGTNGDNGFVYVNGYQGVPPSEGVTNFGGAHGFSDEGLNASSMYVFNVSTLEGTNYIIGDPRTTTVDVPQSWNGNTITWAKASALYTENGEDSRELQYYYPTSGDLDTNSQSANMISPKFRVCSAYGAIAKQQDNRRYYENVKGRCASYQEDGYPAGRWRLPTKAEFEFINTLSNRGLMPTLYEPDMDYWCAHGYGSYNTTDNKVKLTPGDNDYGSRSVSVRCVYDDWYWENFDNKGKLKDKDKFTWGDIPR